MRPERTLKLVEWLRKLAWQEDATASVLAKLDKGDPRECETRARLFREIADTLETVARAQPVPRLPTESDPHPKPGGRFL